MGEIKILKKVMAKLYKSGFCGKGLRGDIILLLALVFCLSFVLAEDSWDSFDEGNGSSEVIAEDLSDNLIEIEGGEVFEEFYLNDSSFEEGDSFEYTKYYYLAWGVGAVGLLIVLLFFYLFFKHPKNSWEK